jgi:hypothetical protein
MALIAVLLAAEPIMAFPSAPEQPQKLDAGARIMQVDNLAMFASPTTLRVQASIGSGPGRAQKMADVMNRAAFDTGSCFAPTANGTSTNVQFVRHEPCILINSNYRDLNGDQRVDPWESTLHSRFDAAKDENSLLQVADLHSILNQAADEMPEVKKYIASGGADNMLSQTLVRTTRLATTGNVDYVIDHADAWPEQSSTHAATADDDAKEFFSQLLDLARKEEVPFDAASIVAKAPEYGAGSLLHMLVFPLLQAFADGRTLFAPQLRLWAPKECESKDMTCYFSSLPALGDYHVDLKANVLRKRTRHGTGGGVSMESVSAQEVTMMAEARVFARQVTNSVSMQEVRELDVYAEKLDIHGLDMDWLQQKEKHIETPVERRLRRACKAADAADDWSNTTIDHCGIRRLDLDLRGFETFEETSLLSRLDPRFTRHGRFWLVTQVLHFLTRPNEQLKAMLDEHRQTTKLSSPYLSLHVRKGDACTARGDCRDLKFYMPHIEKMRAKYGLKSIFLSTPSQSVLDETKNYTDLHFSFMPVTNATQAMRAAHIKQLEEGLGKGVIDAGHEFRAYMVDMYLLAEGSAFMGAFTSNAARLTYSLMSGGTEGCLKPFESTDINWCFAFGKVGPAVIRHDSRACADDGYCHEKGYDQYGC